MEYPPSKVQSGCPHLPASLLSAARVHDLDNCSRKHVNFTATHTNKRDDLLLMPCLLPSEALVGTTADKSTYAMWRAKDLVRSPRRKPECGIACGIVNTL